MSMINCSHARRQAPRGGPWRSATPTGSRTTSPASRADPYLRARRPQPRRRRDHPYRHAGRPGPRLCAGRAGVLPVRRGRRECRPLAGRSPLFGCRARGPAGHSRQGRPARCRAPAEVGGGGSVVGQPVGSGPARPARRVHGTALATLGVALDLHCGGADLAFPHHAFEAAHAEAALVSSRSPVPGCGPGRCTTVAPRWPSRRATWCSSTTCSSAGRRPRCAWPSWDAAGGGLELRRTAHRRR